MTQKKCTESTEEVKCYLAEKLNSVCYSLGGVMNVLKDAYIYSSTDSDEAAYRIDVCLLALRSLREKIDIHIDQLER